MKTKTGEKKGENSLFERIQDVESPSLIHLATTPALPMESMMLYMKRWIDGGSSQTDESTHQTRTESIRWRVLFSFRFLGVNTRQNKKLFCVGPFCHRESR